MASTKEEHSPACTASSSCTPSPPFIMASNMPAMSQHRYRDDYGEASASASAASPYLQYNPGAAAATPISLQFDTDYEDDADGQHHAGSASIVPPPGYDNIYQRSAAGPHWSSRQRHHSSSSSSHGPLLGGSSSFSPTSSSTRAALHRLGGYLPGGRSRRRTTLYLITLCLLALFGWLSLTPSGSERLAALRASSTGLASMWNGHGASPAQAQDAKAHGLESGEFNAAAVAAAAATANEAKWTGWDFARDSSIVYTWVNGSDEKQIDLRVQYGSEKQVGGARDRDNDDLRFSMRSMAAYLPWHRGTVYIVSPTLPTWLNASHPRIRWVNQDTIVPAEYLPVFSSNAVEPFLHLIPGISDRFLVFNDDFMVQRRMEPWDFFTSSGAVKLFLENGIVDLAKHVPETKKTKQAWLYSVHRTIEIMFERYHRRWPNPLHLPRFVKHAPFVYHRGALEELHHLYGRYLAENARHRFRNPDDVLVPFLHHGYVTQEGAACCGFQYDIVPSSIAQQNFFFLSWTDNTTANALALERMERTKPQVAAFNDNMGKGEAAREAQRQMHEYFVRTFDGLPREFELS